MRRLTTLFAVLAACLIAASAAIAATVLHGTTSQGQSASMTVGSGGALKKLLLNWSAHCGNGTTFNDVTELTEDKDVTSHARFVGGYTVTRTISHKTVKARIQNTLVANQQSTSRWTGSFKGTVTERHNGRKITSCPVNFTWQVHG